MKSISTIITAVFLTAVCSISALADEYININTSGASGTGWSFTGSTLTISGNSGTYIITDTATANRIVVSSGKTANITIHNVNIDVSDMTGATVNLTLEGDNTLSSGNSKAGLHAPGTPVSTLKITAASSGSLQASGGRNSAGIGSGYGKAADGSVIITGGSVKMTGNNGPQPKNGPNNTTNRGMAVWKNERSPPVTARYEAVQTNSAACWTASLRSQ
jgi:hypothetical protein